VIFLFPNFMIFHWFYNIFSRFRSTIFVIFLTSPGWFFGAHFGDFPAPPGWFFGDHFGDFRALPGWFFGDHFGDVLAPPWWIFGTLFWQCLVTFLVNIFDIFRTPFLKVPRTFFDKNGSKTKPFCIEWCKKWCAVFSSCGGHRFYELSSAFRCILKRFVSFQCSAERNFF